MSAVRYRFRASWRGRWRAWLARGVLFGVTAGVVLALLLTAQRTDSAATRFADTANAFDVFIPNARDRGIARFDPADVAALPNVVDTAVAGLVYIYIGTGESALATEDNRIGTDLNRFDIIEGRPADPTRVDEAVIGVAMADRYRLDVGDTIQLFDPTQFSPRPLSPEDQRAMDRLRAQLPGLALTVVGIEASPNELPPQPAGTIRSTGQVHLTPALDALTPVVQAGRSIEVQLRNGADDVPAFVDDLRTLGGDKPLNVATSAELSLDTERSLHLQAQALRLLAAMLALAALVILGPLASRTTFAEAGDLGVLAALGTTTRPRAAMALVPGVIAGLVAVPIAVMIALPLTLLGPFGLAGTIEPDPGVWFDPGIVVLGTVGLLVITPLLGLPAAVRSARRGVRGIGLRRGVAASTRVSVVASGAAAVGAPPPVVLGSRLALESAGIEDAVPVRSTVLAVTMSVLMATAAVTLSASLDHLLHDPRSYGLVWTANLTNYGEGSGLSEHATVLRDDPAVEAYAIGHLALPASIEGDRTAIFALDNGKGDALPPVVDGRLPDNRDEIALGTRTSRDLDASIGDTVDVALEGRPSRTLQVVGRVVLPSAGGGHLGEGGLVHLDSQLFAGIDSDSFVGRDVIVRMRPGASLDATSRQFDQFGVVALVFETPADIQSLGKVRALPTAIATLLAAVALGSLANTLVSAIRRRRRDFALLKTFGFVGRQVRTTVLVQATTLVVIGLAGGVPLGVVVGRWTWQLLARQIGVVPVPVTPVPVLLLLVPGALLLGVLVALLPARSAAGTPVADSLKEP